MTLMENLALEIGKKMIENLKEEGYEIGYCDRGHTIENGGMYITMSSFLELVNDLQVENEDLEM